MALSIRSLFAVACAFVLHGSAAEDPTATAHAEWESFLKKIPWQIGPTNSPIGKLGLISVPEGFRLTASKGTKQLLDAMGNPTDDSELALLGPDSLDWFVVFEFSDVGYVKDDDKSSLDEKAMLASIRKGTEEANRLRKKMGVSPLHITGWEIPPRYNEASHHLEWAIRGESEGDPVVNYNTRILGRKGVMEMNLVIDPGQLAATLPIYARLIESYQFNEGQRYAEYRQGDRVAEFGLAALITGGAAVVAYKTGLLAAIILFFKKGWKALVVMAIAVAGGLKKLFGRRTEVGSNEPPPSSP